MRERLVVVGNGMVGLHFVEELLVRADDRYRITVVGKEPEAAYNRVLLSSLLAGEVSAEEVRFRDRTWYAANGIELILGARAESEAIGLCALSRLSAEGTGRAPVRLRCRTHALLDHRHALPDHARPVVRRSHAAQEKATT